MFCKFSVCVCGGLKLHGSAELLVARIRGSVLIAFEGFRSFIVRLREHWRGEAVHGSAVFWSVPIFPRLILFEASSQS